MRPKKTSSPPTQSRSSPGQSQYCIENELELSIFSQTNEHLNRIDPVKELFRRGVNGVIVINAHDDNTFVDKFEEEKLPYCCLISGNAQYPDRILSIDNKTPAAQATEHLIHLGHRHIAFICGDSHARAHVDRLDGYRESMKKAKLIPTITNTMGFPGTEGGFEATRDLLARYPKTTAIFTISETIATGVRAALYQMRLRVPDDISLISCDDSVHARYFAPPLTVIDIPNKNLGYASASWVHAQISNFSTPRPEQESWMKGRLLIRESTARPREL